MPRYRAVIEFDCKDLNQSYYLPWIGSRYELEDGFDAEWVSLELADEFKGEQ